jgi:hypothetical protein
MVVEDSEKATAPVPGPTKPPRFPWFHLGIVIIALIVLMTQGFLIFPLLFLTSLLVLGVVSVYLVAPLKARRTLWISTNPEIREIDLDFPEVPPIVAETFHSTAKALVSRGFVARGTFAIEKLNPNHRSYVALFEDPREQTASIAFSDINMRQKIEQTLAFKTKFADGSEVATTNTLRAPLTPPVKCRKSFGFPGVDDAARLLNLHRRAMVELGEFSARVPPMKSDPIAHIADVFAVELAYQAEIGYLQLETGTGLYRLTVKGACLMAWRQLWPWGTIRRANRRRLAARRLRDWESTGA